MIPRLHHALTLPSDSGKSWCDFFFFNKAAGAEAGSELLSHIAQLFQKRVVNDKEFDVRVLSAAT